MSDTDNSVPFLQTPISNAITDLQRRVEELEREIERLRSGQES